jgi:DNA-binding GntR family transcriptional regulator
MSETILPRFNPDPPTTEAILFPMERDSGLSVRIYLQLRQALMRGKLRPGQKLVHRVLAAELRVSPTPVREAVLRLASEAALSIDQRGIAMVPELDPATYAEILNLRIELEGRAAAAAAARPNAELAAEFTAFHDRMMAARYAGDEDTHLAANEDFHFRILSAAGMPVLARLVESLWMRCGPVLRYYIAHERLVDGHPHLDFIAAVREGNPEMARGAMVRDIENGGRIILRKLAERAHLAAASLDSYLNQN